MLIKYVNRKKSQCNREGVFIWCIVFLRLKLYEFKLEKKKYDINKYIAELYIKNSLKHLHRFGLINNYSFKR